MSRVITFSREFPAYHPKKGQPTLFVEAIWYGLNYSTNYKMICDLNENVPVEDLWNFWTSIQQDLHLPVKGHTIRSGHRWKVGDKFSPRVWSGTPYNSKQIIIAPDIEIVKTWAFEVDVDGIYFINSKNVDPITEAELCQNDGLSMDDFADWFIPNFKKPKEFSGQILCWKESINY